MMRGRTLVERPVDGEARRRSCGRRRRTVARDLADVDVVLRSHADAHLAGRPDLEEHDRLNLARGERQVDQPLGVVVACSRTPPASRRPCTAPRAGPRRASSIESSSAPISFSFPKLLLSNTRRAIVAGFDARLDRLPADVERPRRDVRVMERPGVGQDREVDVGRDLEAQRHAERRESDRTPSRRTPPPTRRAS